MNDDAEPEGFGVETDIDNPEGAVAMAAFHRALRRAEAGEDQARVVFYGASHVAADLFVDVVRDRLQVRFGDAGHGFVLPARPWRGYRHRDVSVTNPRRRWTAHRIRASSREIDRLGLAGMAVEARSSRAWGRIDTREQKAGRFEVYYLQQPRGGSFDILLDGRRKARVNTRAASVQGAYRVVTGSDAPHRLEVRVRGGGPVRLFGVAVERERPGVVVDTLGINGARARSHLLWNEALHTAQLRRRDPDLVVLAYGTNESGDDDHPIERYEADLRRVVNRVRTTVPDASCLLIGPSDRPRRSDEDDDVTWVDRPRTAQIVEVQRRVALSSGCGFFDLVGFGGGPLSMVIWAANDPPYAQPDHIHFTARGYLRLGEVLHDALLDGLEETPAHEPGAAE